MEEKKLLLLGVLRGHDMHGYQLSEMLEKSAGLAITLKKSNAYKLLNKMEEEGWITHREEREGNRPPRRVYTVTSDGKAAFESMLRASLAAYPTPEFPSVVPFNYLDALPGEEVVMLLKQRRQKIEARFGELDAIPEEVRQSHPGIEYLHRYYSAELRWLDKIIDRLNGA